MSCHLSISFAFMSSISKNSKAFIVHFLIDCIECDVRIGNEGVLHHEGLGCAIRIVDARIKMTTKLLVPVFILFPAWFLGIVATMLLDVPPS